MVTFRESLHKRTMNAPDEELIISGDGKTHKTAVKFRRCRLLMRVARERRFICEQYGIENEDWRQGTHFTSNDRQSVWVIDLKDGTSRKVYFDTSQTIYDDE